MAHLPTVAIVGRPNVGKSTLFNRVLAKRLAIVDDRPGVTRDRLFARAEWAGKRFLLVDTGGIVEASSDSIVRYVRRQALTAVEEADTIILVVDSKTGVHPLDAHVAEILRRDGRAVILAANKLDNLPFDHSHQVFWELGVGEPVGVSALSGKGSGDLLDRVVEELPVVPEPQEGEGIVRIAVVGRPNVGKSSLVNRILGEDRAVVSDKPGTTRDPVDSRFRHHGRTLVFVDTAGLRRKAKVKDDLEFYSAVRTERVVHDSDVCVVMTDDADPLAAQDVRVLRMAWDAGKGVILIVNKWDLVEKDTMTAPRIEREMCERAPFLKAAPVVFASALTGQRARRCLDLALEVDAERGKRIATSEVNEVLAALVGRQPPPVHRGRHVKIRYAAQVSIRPPTFAVFANYPGAIPDHYVRYLKNGFRAAWPFRGSAIRVRLRDGRRRRARTGVEHGGRALERGTK